VLHQVSEEQESLGRELHSRGAPQKLISRKIEHMPDEGRPIPEMTGSRCRQRGGGNRHDRHVIPLYQRDDRVAQFPDLHPARLLGADGHPGDVQSPAHPGRWVDCILDTRRVGRNRSLVVGAPPVSPVRGSLRRVHRRSATRRSGRSIALRAARSGLGRPAALERVGVRRDAPQAVPLAAEDQCACIANSRRSRTRHFRDYDPRQQVPIEEDR